MDLATLIGMIGALSVICYALLISGSIFMFVDLTALIIVVAGTILIILIRWDFVKFMTALKVASKAFFVSSNEPLEVINTCLSLSKAARKGGILSLDSFDLSKSPILKQGVQLLLEGYDQKAVNEILSREMNLTLARHTTGQAIFENAVDVAPAMGLIGTLIAMVQMLSNMADPNAIGPAMAMALLSTLYGIIIANIICAPIVDKLILRTNQEMLLRQIVIDAMTGMQNGQSTQALEFTLRTYLPPVKRMQIASISE
jgi:chemotaxis protein MotA